MSKLRIHRAEMVSVPVLRIYRAEMTGSAVVISKLRIYRAEISGTAAVVVAPFTPLASPVEPETLVSITAALLGGGGADSWTWRRVSGPASSLTSAGATATLKTPSVVPAQGQPPVGATVVLGVKATIGSVVSAEQTITIPVLPQLEFAGVGSGPWAAAPTVY